MVGNIGDEVSWKRTVIYVGVGGKTTILNHFHVVLHYVERTGVVETYRI